MHADLLENDIMTFTHDRMSSNVKRQAIGEETFEKIRPSSEGIFLWASIVLEDLTRENNTNERALHP